MPPSPISYETIRKFSDAFWLEVFNIAKEMDNRHVERMADDDPDHPMFGQNKLPDAVRRALERHSKILTSSEILGQWSGLEWITVSQTCHACGHVTKRVFSNADKIRCACCNHIQPMEGEPINGNVDLRKQPDSVEV